MQERVRTAKPRHQQRPALPAPSDAFRAEKQRVLAALESEAADKSRAGAVDAQAVPWLRVVNAKQHLYTASSCAGRLIVTLNSLDGAGYGIPWLFVSHDPVDDAPAMVAAVEAALAPLDDAALAHAEVWFKLEPPILAVVCASAAAANKVMGLARGAAGIKRCSVISLRDDGAHVLSVSDTKRVETLLCAGSRHLLVPGAYVATLVAVANRKLRESRVRIDALMQALAGAEAFAAVDGGGHV